MSYLKFNQSGTWVDPELIQIAEAGNTFANVSNVYMRTGSTWTEVWPGGGQPGISIDANFLWITWTCPIVNISFGLSGTVTSLQMLNVQMEPIFPDYINMQYKTGAPYPYPEGTPVRDPWYWPKAGGTLQNPYYYRLTANSYDNVDGLTDQPYYYNIYMNQEGFGPIGDGAATIQSYGDCLQNNLNDFYWGLRSTTPLPYYQQPPANAMYVDYGQCVTFGGGPSSAIWNANLGKTVNIVLYAGWAKAFPYDPASFPITFNFQWYTGTQTVGQQTNPYTGQQVWIKSLQSRTLIHSEQRTCYATKIPNYLGPLPEAPGSQFLNDPLPWDFAKFQVNYDWNGKSATIIPWS